MALKIELITEGYLAEVRLAEILMENGYQYRWDYRSETLYVREDPNSKEVDNSSDSEIETFIPG